MKIALIQMNPIIGDLYKNAEKIIDFAKRAFDSNADLAVFPELSLTGYPPKDLLLRNDFLQAQEKILNKIAQQLPIPALIGAAIKPENSAKPFNALVLCESNSWAVNAKKILLPNYNVFDEKRYFMVPDEPFCSVVTIKGKKLLLSICEDAWASLKGSTEDIYEIDPIDRSINKFGQPDAIINVMASPFSSSKPAMREKLFAHIAQKYHTPVLVAGQVGANDQLLFDGHSLVVNGAGLIVERAALCTENVLVVDIDAMPEQPTKKTVFDKERLLLKVIAMGIKDYVEKCSAKGVLIGLSGGIDSSLCAALAVDALGKDRVYGVFLPSRFTSERSLNDMHDLASRLDINVMSLPIEPCLHIMRQTVWKQKLSLPQAYMDIVDQNLQSRLRGLLIMAISNADGFLMVATSNKSELSVGYATIYGDMCGAFSPIGDVYKTEVYKLAKAFNQNKGQEIIPESIIKRAPTAELKPDQLDSDSLPDYETLDKILYNFIDLEKSVAEIEMETGFGRDIIESVVDMIAKSEYKRRQGPFPLMVSDKVFGDARRQPIAKRVPHF